jgi:CDP-glucose 4,6-dehydratase
MLAGLDNPENHGQTFNFALGGNWKVEAIVRTIQEISNTTTIPIKFIPADHGEIKDQAVSNEKARRLLNWKPQYELREALCETAQWYFRQFIMRGIEKGDFGRKKVSFFRV